MMTDQTEEAPRAVVDETEWLEYMLDLHQRELAGERGDFSIGPYAAMVMIGALQMATRHPEMTETSRNVLLSIVDQYRPWFAGTLGERLIDLGNDPTQDR